MGAYGVVPVLIEAKVGAELLAVAPYGTAFHAWGAYYTSGRAEKVIIYGAFFFGKDFRETGAARNRALARVGFHYWVSCCHAFIKTIDLIWRGGGGLRAKTA